jgi:hypothetical protein
LRHTETAHGIHHSNIDLDDRVIRGWIGDAVGSYKNERAPARACLIKYGISSEARQGKILDFLLELGLGQYKSTEGKTFTSGNSMIAAIFTLLKSHWTDSSFDDLARAAGLRLVKNWDVLLTQSFERYPLSLTVSPAVKDAILVTRYLRYLVDKSVVPHSIFIVFWEQMLALLRLSTSKTSTAKWPADIIHSVLEETSAFVFTNAACLEIHTFYEAVEEVCTQLSADPKRQDMPVFRVSTPRTVIQKSHSLNIF